MAWSTVNVNYLCNGVWLNEPFEVLQILYYRATTVCVITCRTETVKQTTSMNKCYEIYHLAEVD